MPDGRGARLALEAGFLVAVAAAAAYADLRPAWIVVAMLAGWAIVALLEWVSWRAEPHWGSGQPPRYHVPEQPLPPRPPGVELPSFRAYPQPSPREPEAPTWIATPQMRAELLGWPTSVETPPAEEPQTTVEELPEELLAVAAEAGWPVAEPAGDPWEPAPEQEPEPQPAAVAPLASPVRHRIDPYAEPERPRRRWRRGGGDDGEGVVELPAVPPHVRFASGLEEDA